MKNVIYYFSGTGNSLDIARRLHDSLDDIKLIPLPVALNHDRLESSETTGIVTPIYMHKLPYIVVDFIKKLKNTKYLFIVLSGGGETGNCIKFTQRLCANNNLTLSAIFNVKMPSNYIPFGCPSLESQQKDLENANTRVAAIANIVKSQSEHFDKNSNGFIRSNIFPGLLYKLGYSMIKKMDKRFTVDDKCSSCGICASVCPVDNIKLVDGKPVWQSDCQQCFACLQWCPEQAIQVGKRTATIDRYRNPNVNVKDIIESKIG